MRIKEKEKNTFTDTQKEKGYCNWTEHNRGKTIITMLECTVDGRHRSVRKWLKIINKSGDYKRTHELAWDRKN